MRKGFETSLEHLEIFNFKEIFVLYIYTYIYIYVCVLVCVCVYIYIYIYNRDICEKFYLSLSGLKSHLRKCVKSILHPNNVTTSKTERLCQFRGKFCRSLTGLKSHLRTHTIYGGIREGGEAMRLRKWSRSKPRGEPSYIYTYVYCHPQTDCFVLPELFSVARHVGRLKPGSKPIQLYVRLSIRPLGQKAYHVG